MSVEITGLYTAMLAILFVGLSINVIRFRFSEKVGIGDGGSKSLAQAIRVHGNFSEYIPIALLLMAIYEINNGHSLLLHAMGLSLFAGRLFHAIGLMKTQGTSLPRVIGTLLTFSSILCLSVLNIVHFFL